jgi:DNA-binding MarR family transcriptional regulator
MDQKEMPDADYLAELSALGIASRLRRLLQRLLKDGERVYRSQNLDFKLKWFPVFHLLSDRSHLTITKIAQLLSISHPSAIETVSELVSVGLVNSRRCDMDRRCLELTLTDKGKQLHSELLPVWDGFRAAGEAVNREGGNDFLEAVGKLERALHSRSMYDRIMAKLKNQRSRRTRRKVKHLETK